jgi:hypothetical protein
MIYASTSSAPGPSQTEFAPRSPQRATRQPQKARDSPARVEPAGPAWAEVDHRNLRESEEPRASECPPERQSQCKTASVRTNNDPNKGICHRWVAALLGLNLRRYAPVKACPVIQWKRVDCTGSLTSTNQFIRTGVHFSSRFTTSFSVKYDSSPDDASLTVQHP